MTRLLFILIFFLGLIACNPEQPSQTITATFQAADDSTSFIPKGYKISEEYNADLNLDSLTDKLVLLCVDTSLDKLTLSKLFPDTVHLHTQPYQQRPLIVLLRQPDSSLKQAARNDYITWGAPVEGLAGTSSENITVGTGVFSVEYFYHGGGGHSTQIVSFKYSATKNDWLLNNQTLVYTSDTPTDSGGYDDMSTETKTAKDFGEISFSDYRPVE